MTNSLALNGRISGTGGLIKTGAGTLFVNDITNSYSGDTWVKEGTLVIADGAALGQSANLQLNGGTLANTLATSIKQNVAVTDRGTLDVLDTLTLNGDLSGSGGLIKKGIGKLVLEGASTYTGTTRVDEGELSGTATSLAGTITVAEASRITFDQQQATVRLPVA